MRLEDLKSAREVHEGYLEDEDYVVAWLLELWEELSGWRKTEDVDVDARYL